MIYQLLNVCGDDAEVFLQGQLTQDLVALTPDTALPAAWCTPKGRVVATMRLIRRGECIGLLLPGAIADTFVKRISIYKLRAAVQFETPADWQTVAVESESDLQRLQNQHLLPQNRLNCCISNGELTAINIADEPMVVEVFGPTDEIRALALESPLAETEWLATLIRSGSVQISDDNTEKYTPHMISLDLAGAVSFNKGCYTGQEIVARTEHRGKSRRRLARYSSEKKDIAAGDELLDGDRAVGVVVNAAGGEILAVTPADIHGKDLLVGGVEARACQLF